VWRDGGPKIVFIPGEPALFLTSRERAWKAAVKAAGLADLANPALHFTVASFHRMGHRFDIDNLAKPVLECVAGQATTVWVTTRIGNEPGVRVMDEAPPPSPQDVTTIVIESPRSRSVRPLVPMEAFIGLTPLGEPDQPIAIELAFAADSTAISDFGFTGPIKPLIDGMGTVLGPAPQGPADYRIRDLRVTKGNDPLKTGVTVKIWLAAAQ